MIGQQFGLQTGFNMPIKKPVNKFPGFSEKQIQQLYKDTANVPIEKRAEVQYQLYKEILSQIKNNELKDKRIEAKANRHNDSLEQRDPAKKSISQAQLRMEDLADEVKDKFNLIPTAPTNEVLEGFSKMLADQGVDPKLADDYLNGKSEELLYVSGIKDRPMQQPGSLGEKIAGGEILPFADPLRPYEQGEGAGEYIGETLMNVPGSAWNIVAGLGNMLLTPGKTLKGLGKMVSGAGVNVAIGAGKAITGKEEEEVKEIMYNSPVYNFFKDNIGVDFQENEELADAMGGFFAERYGGIENIKKTFKEDPVGIIGDVVGLLEGGVGIAGKAGIISQAQKTSMLSKLAKVQPYTQVPLQTAKVGGKIVKGTAKGLSNMSEAVMNKLTAIDKEDRVFARKNPDLVNSYVNGTKTVDDVAQTIAQKMDDIQSDRKVLGQEYETIRASGQTADTSKIIETIQPKLADKKIIVNKDGTLTFDKFSKFNKPQQNAINEAWKIVKDAGMEGKLDTDQILNLRQKIDDLVNWEGKPLKASGVDREAETLIKSFRKEIDNQAKTIQGLSDLDAKYGPVLEEANTLRKDWFNADGTLKDNALSKIKNLTNDANKQKLARLEKIMPGITDELRGLKVGLAVDTAMKSRVGQYAQQMLLGGGVVSVFTNPALILPLVGAGIVLTPKNIINTLQAIGKGQEWVSGVVNKIKGGNKLSTIEEARVGSLLKSKQDELSTLKDSLDLDTKPINANTKNNMNNMAGGDNIMKQQKVKSQSESIPQLKATVKAPDEQIIAEARKYKSADDFVESISDKLYALNKKAKGYRGSGLEFSDEGDFLGKIQGTKGELERNRLYNIKNKIISKFGEKTGAKHKFGMGFGEEFTIEGKGSFHNYKRYADDVIKSEFDDAIKGMDVGDKFVLHNDYYRAPDNYGYYIGINKNLPEQPIKFEMHFDNRKPSELNIEEIAKKIFTDYEAKVPYGNKRYDRKEITDMIEKAKTKATKDKYNGLLKEYEKNYDEILSKRKEFIKENKTKRDSYTKEYKETQKYINELKQSKEFKKLSEAINIKDKYKEIGNISSENVKGIELTEQDIEMLDKVSNLEGKTLRQFREEANKTKGLPAKNESIPQLKATVKAPEVDTSYRIGHQIDTKKSSPITSIDLKKIDTFVDEFKRQYGYPSLKSKELNKFKEIMKNPEADVKIYRASPKNELNQGDWVTIDKTYANDIKRQNGGKVYEYTVKAKELLYPNTVEGFNELPSLNKRGAFQYNSKGLKPKK